MEMKYKVPIFLLALTALAAGVAKAGPVQSQHHQGREIRYTNPIELDKILEGNDMSAPVGLLTLGLVGATVALISNSNDLFNGGRNGGGPANRRSDDDYYGGRNSYAARVNQFEDNVLRRLSHTARNTRNWVSRGVHKGVRRIGAMGHVGARLAHRGMSSVSRGAKALGNIASRGLRRVGGAGINGLKQVGYGLARVGLASRRGVQHFGRSYVNSMAHLRRKTADRIARIGSTYARGVNNVRYGISRMGDAYWRGISRMGNAAHHATSRLGVAASDGVTRIGDMASTGAQQLGGLASGLAEAASEVPMGVARSVAAVAKEKKVQDCLLQTICYVTTPHVERNELAKKRRRRMIRSLVDNANDNDEDGGRRFDEDVEELGPDDCELFQCPVASFGRTALGIVRSFSDEERF